MTKKTLIMKILFDATFLRSHYSVDNESFAEADVVDYRNDRSQ